jgi:putative colanic acid biosynthesis UDP-glucose lipid carrier transferase
VLSTIILVLISPLLPAIAIGVKLSSPGPVIFRQRRNGLDGGEIVVYKFRSMTTQDDGPVVRQATKSDPRITRFGAFLRRTSLDELPQFFNVLQGKMSIVGPRPHAVAHNEEYRPASSRPTWCATRSSRASPAGPRSTASAARPTRSRRCARASNTISSTCATGRWVLDLRIIAGTVRLLFFDRHAY